MVAVVRAVPVTRTAEHQLAREHTLPGVIRLLNNYGSYWLDGDLRIIGGNLLRRHSERNQKSRRLGSHERENVIGKQGRSPMISGAWIASDLCEM
jgi:hypothetical protein